MIEKILSPKSIQVGKSFKTKEQATIAAGKILLDNGYINEEYISSMLEKLDKESYATFIGNGVAIPHGMLKDVKHINRTGISFIQVPDGVDWNGETAYIIVGIAGIGEEQVDILSALANEIENEEDAKRLQKLGSVDEIYKTLTRIAVHFGAGNIGRGFIAPVLKENRYNVTFIDSAKDLVDKINIEKQYKVHSYSNDSKTDEEIESVSALHIEQHEELREILNNSLLITTSVGPANLDLVASLLNKYIDENKKIDFIAFENIYRASSYVNEKEKGLDSKIEIHDVVVDKIVPLQKIDNLDVIVENFGSIVFDENQYSSKLIELNEIVTKGSYEKEFTKKQWLLNGLHVCLSYYGLSQGIEYIHELYTKKEHKEFITEINNEYREAFCLFSKIDAKEIKLYQEEINNRFKDKMLKDHTVRVARNPKIKFSKSERVHGPLHYLVQNGSNFSAMKLVIELLFNHDFVEVEGFTDFKEQNLRNGREEFYTSFWGQEELLSEYKTKLGA